MTPIVMDDGFAGDRRGTDDQPAEGRRSYDKPDATLDRVDMILTRLRHIALGVGMMVGLVVGTAAWLGFRAVGPGTRFDDLQATVDRNKSERAYQDSVISFRLSRLERVVTTMAYQTCIADDKTPRSDCTRIFTDGVQ